MGSPARAAEGILAAIGVASIEPAGHILYEEARLKLRSVPGALMEHGNRLPTPASRGARAVWHHRRV